MNSGREDKNPWDPWFWQDYDSDPNLRACSLAAQGLWMRMLCIMAKSEKKGYLMINGKPVDSKLLAKLVGEEESIIEGLINELKEYGVPSIDEEGVIFNRRMVREAKKRSARSEAGKKGMASRWKRYNKSYNKSCKKDDNKSMKTDNNDDSKEITLSPLLSNNKTITNEITDAITPSVSASVSVSEYVSENDKKKEYKEGKEELENVRFNRWVEEMMIKWNQFAETHGLAEIKGVIKGSTRERHLRARFNEPSFDMEKILEKISKSDFLLGIKTDWKATFDWLICPSNYVKVLEGNYDSSHIPKDSVRASRVGENRERIEYPPNYWEKVRELRGQGFSGQALTDALAKIPEFQAFFQKNSVSDDWFTLDQNQKNILLAKIKSGEIRRVEQGNQEG